MSHTIEKLPVKLAVSGSAVIRHKSDMTEPPVHSEGEAYLPTYGSEYANGFDLRTPVAFHVNKDLHVSLDLGWATALPDGYGMLVLPRSGLGNRGMVVTNTIGLIDQDYRGNIIVNITLRADATEPMMSFDAGDRIAQAVIVPMARVKEFAIVDELPPSTRGDGGFGSSGVV